MPSGRRKPALVALSHLQLDKASDNTLRRSLYWCLRGAIVRGEITAGSRLPSTRFLAAELAISRNTVSDAFAQLVAEGFLVARHGSGTFVAAVAEIAKGSQPVRTAWERASERGKLFAARSSSDSLTGRPALPFQPGLPAYEHFPFDAWARIAARILRRPKPDLLGYGHSAGYAPLREVIAADIRSRNGRACRDEQIIIVGGTSQAFDLVCRLALDPGDRVWLEDPSSLYARATLTSAGADVVGIPVDWEGIDVDAGVASAPGARLVHVTSAHQWPMGPAMSERRRAALLAWADAADAWIVEDEYDGVFRYDGMHPASLWSLDRADRLIAIGSFSLTTFPAIRLGYIVAPPGLVEAFTAAKATVDRQASLFEQAILADFIYDGHYARHCKAMTGIYAGRQDALLRQLNELGAPKVLRTEAGLHVVLPLARNIDDVVLSQAARQAGVVAPALSPHYLRPEPSKGLILGFGVGSTAAMEMAATKLCREILATPRAHASPRVGSDIPG